MKKRLHVVVCVVIFALLFSTLYSCSGKKTTGKTTGTSPTVKTTVKASGTVKTTTRPTGTQQTTGADSGSDQIADGETGNGEIPGEEPGGSSAPSEFLSYDFGGRTIYIDLIAGTPGIDLITDYDDRTFDRYNADGVYIKGFSKYLDLRYDHWRDVEQKMNCKIRVKWHANPAQTGWINGPKRMMQDILSGTYQYDLCWPHNTLATFIKNNFAIPLDDYIDIDSIEKLRDPVVRASGTMRGKLYIVSEDVPDYGFAPKIGIQLQPIQYNPVIRDREGLPDLFELFKTGSWTWEKLTEIALTATCDINGDGVTDQWGACYFDANALAACMSHSNGMPLIEEVNGRLVHNLATPEFMRAMTIVSDLINVYKVLAPDRTYYIKGTSYMYLGGQFSTHTLVFYRDGKIKSRFVPFPIGPDNDEGKIVSELNKYGYCMPATEKDPNGIARLMVNLFWTMTDPGRPQLTYNEKIESARIYFDSFFWPGASNDLADLLDFWIDGIDGTKYISPSKTDIWLNGFGTLQSAMGTNIFSQLQKATPVSQAVYSAIPKIEGILNEFN